MYTNLDQMFGAAHTQYGYTNKPVATETLRTLYDLVKAGPTAFNMQPARLAFVTSAAEKEKLITCVGPGNVEKIRQAPVTVVIGMDLKFFEHLPTLFPAYDAKAIFAGNEAAAQGAAMRNSSLQGGYLIMAARALGLDCGPMSGFDHGKVDAAFWAGTSVKTNFLCSLGYGDKSKEKPRGPRLSFEQACRVL